VVSPGANGTFYGVRSALHCDSKVTHALYSLTKETVFALSNPGLFECSDSQENILIIDGKSSKLDRPTQSYFVVDATTTMLSSPEMERFVKTSRHTRTTIFFLTQSYDRPQVQQPLGLLQHEFVYFVEMSL
jgi:hypothetical protein